MKEPTKYKFGVVGKPLSHSNSPDYFNKKFIQLGINAEYAAYELESVEDIAELVKSNPELVGLNVTIPYKQSILPYLDQVDREAYFSGAVNTIVVKNTRKRKKLYGYNTDLNGIEASLDRLLNGADSINALILGTGGASRAVGHVLKKRGISYLLVSRQESKLGQISYLRITENILNDFKLIINTSPVGMYPDIDEQPDIPLEFINDSHYVLDLIYKPDPTLLLKSCSEAGAKTLSGKLMFEKQAEAAWQLWKSQTL